MSLQAAVADTQAAASPAVVVSPVAAEADSPAVAADASDVLKYRVF